MRTYNMSFVGRSNFKTAGFYVGIYYVHSEIHVTSDGLFLQRKICLRAYQ